MKPLYRSRFDIVWDGIFIVGSSVLLFQIPFFIYAPTIDMYLEYQLFLIPLNIVALLAFYSWTVRIMTIYPGSVVFERPLAFSGRTVSVNAGDITQVEIEKGPRPRIKVYHHASELSILLYDDEILAVKRAFAQINIPVD